MENQEQRHIIKTINEYLSLMPKANRYNVCRQQETKKMLEFLVSKGNGTFSKAFDISMLQNFLKSVKKWDGVTHEPEDVSFQLLLLDVQIELKRIRAKLQTRTSDQGR
jgi:hypothetical protein